MDSVPRLKRCSTCGVDKPFDQFHKDKSRCDGYRDKCKSCVRDYQARWLPDYVARVQENRIAPASKACTQCGIEKPLADFHKTPNTIDGVRPLCKTCACEYQHEHRFDVRYADRIKEYDRLKYHTKPDEQRKQSNKRIRELHKQRYWSNEAFRVRERRRRNHKHNQYRLRKSGNGGSHTLAEWLELCKHYHYLCLCCGQKLPLARDHIIPVKQGGTDDISNIQPLCRSCNSIKGAKTIDYRPI